MSITLSKPNPIAPKAFRHDINGLRAWAVVAVVLYHFGVPGFSGGFVGVDVFFVISGFLMTSIIISGLEQGSFSLWSFYLARARRIIPALLVLCISLLVIGWFWLPSADYKILSTHAATALAFVSNFKFWREAGYFDVASHEKWLLHTWSLSVEWQFYILLPLGCLLLWHWFSRSAVKLALIAAGLLSLFLSVYASARWPEAAFYLLPTRAWEMLAGGLVWWATRTQPMPRKMAVLAEVVGLALIIISILCFDPAMQWPGYMALVPVLGAMLVLGAQRQHSLWTANYVARRLGASSYSIYLWHWPLVVLLAYAGETANPMWVVGGIGLSVLLGEVSYRWVENITRSKLVLLNKIKESLTISIPVGVAVLASCFVYITNGIDFDVRYGATSEKSKYIGQYATDNYLTTYVKAQYKEECNFFDADSYVAKKTSIPDACAKKHNGNGLFLWGDSHAQALSFGIRGHLNDGVDFYQIASSACQPHIGGDTVTTGEFKVACDKSNQAAIDAITRLKPKIVVMAQRYDHDKNHYNMIVQRLLDIGVKKIVIIGPVPQWQPTLPRTIALRHFDKTSKMFSDNAFDKNVFLIDENMKRQFASSNDVTYISLLDQLCQNGKCLAKVDDNNTPLVWDYGHLSLPGSDFIAGHVLSKNSVFGAFLK